jgi:hypothetical protein
VGGAFAESQGDLWSSSSTYYVVNELGYNPVSNSFGVSTSTVHPWAPRPTNVQLLYSCRLPDARAIL